MESLPPQSRDSWFRQVVEARHAYARAWKARTGRPVVGYLCSYVPEELIYAAGALPVRILGSLRPQELAEAHIPSMYCSFSRDCLAEGLSGKYDYLDGLVLAKSCIHLQQAYECWTRNLPLAYSYFLPMPWVLDAPESRAYYLTELRRFKDSLEAWAGQALTPQAVGEAIKLHNEYRQAMHRLYELRRREPPRLSGLEAAEIALSSMLADKAEHLGRLARAVAEIPHRPTPPRPSPRLMIAGGENYDLELFRVVESLGANVVVDELCMGTRYFWNLVLEDPDPLEALADRYMSRPPCPSKACYPNRYQHVLGLARDFSVQGVLLIQQKFCSPHALDIPDLARFLKENGIPSYFFELDITLSTAQLRTRTEAFLEMLELEVA